MREETGHNTHDQRLPARDGRGMFQGTPLSTIRIECARRGMINPYDTRMVNKRHIENYAKRIGRKFHPQRVILFGSYASGMATEDSDVDLLVIMDHDKSRNIEQAIEIQLAADAAFPMDLIVRRPDEVSKRLAMNDTFLTGLLNDGEVLYG